MCGRFTQYHPLEEVTARFAVQQVAFALPPRYNIAPSQTVGVVIENGLRRLEGYKWGLVPPWAKDPQLGNRMINARAETLAEKPAFKHALAKRRCLVPADGFYEWKGAGKHRQPVLARLRQGQLFAFAGLWEEWHPPGDPALPALRTFTIITAEPNSLLATVHQRMAVILRPEDEAIWLDNTCQDPFELLHVLRPYPDEEMELYPVSPRVNSPAVDEPACVEPIEAAS